MVWTEPLFYNNSSAHFKQCEHAQPVVKGMHRHLEHNHSLKSCLELQKCVVNKKVQGFTKRKRERSLSAFC